MDGAVEARDILVQIFLWLLMHFVRCLFFLVSSFSPSGSFSAFSLFTSFRAVFSSSLTFVIFAATPYSIALTSASTTSASIITCPLSASGAWAGVGPVEDAAEGPVGTTAGATGPKVGTAGGPVGTTAGATWTRVGPEFVRGRAAEALQADEVLRASTEVLSKYLTAFILLRETFLPVHFWRQV